MFTKQEHKGIATHRSTQAVSQRKRKPTVLLDTVHRRRLPSTLSFQPLPGREIRQSPHLVWDLYKRSEWPSAAIPCWSVDADFSAEGSVFAPNAAVVSQVETFFHNNYPGLTDADAHKIPSFYPLEPPLPKHNVWFPSASAAYGDATFICPTYVILNSLLNSATVSKPSSRSNGVESSSVGIWSYRYNVHDAYNTAQGLGIPHVYESFAVFGVDMLPMGPSSQSYRTYNAPIIPVVMNYWISFVRALDPNVYRDPAAPEWQPWTSQHRRMLLQTGASAMENLTSIEEARCSFWQSIGPTIQQKR